jgi:hypothetical protein
MGDSLEIIIVGGFVTNFRAVDLNQKRFSGDPDT